MNRLHFHPDWSGLLACGQRMLLIGACLWAEGTLDPVATGATLEQLFNGSVINAGNSQFSDWELISLDSTSAVNPDLSQIAVVPLVDDPSNPGMQFDANGQLSTSGVNSLDFVFKFRVHALAGGNAFTNHALALTGISFGSNGGLANISDDVIDSSGADLGPTLVIADKDSNFTQSLDTSVFAPQLQVSVVTNVFINGLSAADTINLASFTQRFSQTGLAVLTGDFNEDGGVDLADMDLLCSEVSTGGGHLVFDVTDDGSVDRDDVSRLLELTDRLPGDADYDGQVQFPDFVALADSFGQPGTWSSGDFDCTGGVLFPDFVILADNFRQVAAASVPEPAIVVHVFLATMCLSWFRPPTSISRDRDR